MSLRTVTVTDIDGDGAFALCQAHDSNEADRDVLASLVVEEAFQALSGMEKYAHWQAQPRLLYAIRRIVIAQESGTKNPEREAKVFSALLALYGMDELAKLLGVEAKIEEAG